MRGKVSQGRSLETADFAKREGDALHAHPQSRLSAFARNRANRLKQALLAGSFAAVCPCGGAPPEGQIAILSRK